MPRAACGDPVVSSSPRSRSPSSGPPTPTRAASPRTPRRWRTSWPRPGTTSRWCPGATSTRAGSTPVSRPCPAAPRTSSRSRAPCGRCRWARPDTWVRAGRRLRGLRRVVVVHVIPPSCRPTWRCCAPPARAGAHAGPAPASSSSPTTCCRTRRTPGDRQLMQALLRRVDAVLVHSAEQAGLAHELGARAGLGRRPPAAPARRRTRSSGRRTTARRGCWPWASCASTRASTCCCGPCRGARPHPDRRRRDVGRERRARSGSWPTTRALRGRVEVHGGYVPADRLAALLASHDVLALTYRSATASQNALLGQRPRPARARLGRRHLRRPGARRRRRAARAAGRRAGPRRRPAPARRARRAAPAAAEVRTPDLSGPWAHYVGAIEALASPSAAAGTAAGPGRPRGPDDPTSDGPDDAGGGDRAVGRGTGPAPSLTAGCSRRCAVRWPPGARRSR